MINLRDELTVNDLIIEYMMYKIQNGFNPNFTTKEFIDFLIFFKERIDIHIKATNSEKLFKDFFDKKYQSSNPHMDMEYNNDIDDYIIKANYNFSDFDKSISNTYFMNDQKVWKIRSTIQEYVKNQTKRVLDENIKPSEKELLIGKYISAEIFEQIWNSYVNNKINDKKWPTQCTDINKYLFDIDLAKIIEVDSIKDELIELYNVLSKRISILYNLDKKLKVNSYENSYLAYSNYRLLIQENEKLMNIAFGAYKKTLKFDLESSTFSESHEIGGYYDWDEDPDIKTTTTKIENNKVKRLIKNIEQNN